MNLMTYMYYIYLRHIVICNNINIINSTLIIIVSILYFIDHQQRTIISEN